MRGRLWLFMINDVGGLVASATEKPTGQGVTNYVRGQTVVNSNDPNPFLPKIRLNAFYRSTVGRQS